MDLYPFYPPLVKLIRPRFHGFLMGLDLLKLSKWNPVRTITDVLKEIRSTIVETGTLDLDNPANDNSSHPEGAYTELEYLLLRLEILTEIQSRSAMKRAAAANNSSPSSNSNPATPSKTTRVVNTYWAKGTGYGHSDYDSWDIDAYNASQKEKDTQTQQVLKVQKTRFPYHH